MKSTVNLALALAAVCTMLFSTNAMADKVSIRGLFDKMNVSDSGQSLASEVSLQKEQEEPKNTEWGGFGGPMVQYLMIDLAPLDTISDDRGLDSFDNNLLLVGGIGGAIYKDYRFGGFGFGGSQHQDKRVAGDERDADISIGGGGVFIEYNRSLNSRIGILAGSMFGAAGINIETDGKDMDPAGLKEKSWSESADAFIAYPYVGAWLGVTDWFWLQLNAGYLYFNVGDDEFKNDDLNVKMTDGDLEGGVQASLLFNFGFNPNTD